MSKTIIRKSGEISSRRNFIIKTWKILGLIVAAEFTFFSFNLFKTGKERTKAGINSKVKTIGAVDDFPLNSVTPDRINKCYLIRLNDGGFLALSLSCTHLGCSVTWDETKNHFSCPCHSSIFDKYGDVQKSPAPRPLDFYLVFIEKGLVKIDFSTKVRRNKFEKKQLTYAV